MKYLLDDNRFTFTIREMVYDRNKIWFADSTCNELYCYDMKSQNVEYLAKLEDEKEYQSRLIGDIVIFADTLYAIPFSGKNIYEIDLISKEVRKNVFSLKNPTEYLNYTEGAKFNSAHRYKNCIYLVGTTYPAIVEYNCLTKELHYYDAWIEDCSKFFDEKEIAFFRKSILVGNKIYAPSCMRNSVLEFDIETKLFIWNEVGGNSCSYSSITLHGEWFWLSPRGKGPIVKWHRDTKNWKELDGFPVLYNPCDGSFGDIIYFNGYFYCIPIFSNRIIRVEEETDKIEICMQEYGDWNSASACIADNQMFIYSDEMSQLVVIDKSGKIECRKLIMPEKQNSYHQIHNSYVYRVFKGEISLEDVNMIFCEYYSEEMSDYLGYVKGKVRCQDEKSLVNTNGHRIYSSLR